VASCFKPRYQPLVQDICSAQRMTRFRSHLYFVPGAVSHPQLPDSVLAVPAYIPSTTIDLPTRRSPRHMVSLENHDHVPPKWLIKQSHTPNSAFKAVPSPHS
jgi:hypothetical protein